MRLLTNGPTPSLGARLVVDGDRFAVGVSADGKDIYTVMNGITINGDGTVFVVVETPFATGQTLRVLTNWETRLK